jgi:hypothetical protein
LGRDGARVTRAYPGPQARHERRARVRSLPSLLSSTTTVAHRRHHHHSTTMSSEPILRAPDYATFVDNPTAYGPAVEEAYIKWQKSYEKWMELNAKVRASSSL